MFVIDTNVFIQAHRIRYPFDIFPGFWDALLHHFRAGNLVSIDRVKQEIANGDALAQWVRNAPNALFATSAEQGTVDNFREIMAWATDADYTLEAKKELARVADGWVAAYAKNHDGILVTEEVYNAAIRKKIPLPNLCETFQIPWENCIYMLRELNIRFD